MLMKDKKGNTPFSLLIKKSYHKLREFIKLAKEYGVDINQEFKYKGKTHRATTFIIQEKSRNMVIPDIEYLKSEGADVNLGNEEE